MPLKSPQNHEHECLLDVSLHFYSFFTAMYPSASSTRLTLSFTRHHHPDLKDNARQVASIKSSCSAWGKMYIVQTCLDQSPTVEMLEAVGPVISLFFPKVRNYFRRPLPFQSVVVRLSPNTALIPYLDASQFQLILNLFI